MMTNMADKILSSVAKPILNLLNDSSVEQKTNASDREAGATSVNASSASQACGRKQYGFYPPKETHDKFWSQSTEPNSAHVNPMKLVEIQSREWSGTAVSGTNVIQTELPLDFYKGDKFPAYGQTRYFGSMRASFDFEIQVNGATGCSGSLIIYYIPAAVDKSKLNWRASPLLTSVIHNVGQNTTSKLHVPYTSDHNYANTDSNDLGSLYIDVWTPLQVPTGFANSITVVLYGSMCELDLQCPRVFTTQGLNRGKIEICEGVGSMNLATGVYTRRLQTVALCGETVAQDTTTAGSERGVSSVKELLEVGLPIGITQGTGIWYPWNSTSAKDEVLVNEVLKFSSLNNLTEFIGNGFAFWRGTIYITVQVMCSTLHKGRLKVGWFPKASNSQPTQEFDSTQANNAFYGVADIGLNSSFTLAIPFQSNTWCRDCGEDIGRLKVFVNSKLSVSSAMSPSVLFVVYSSLGDDLELLVPTTRGIHYQAPPLEYEEDDEDKMLSWGDRVEKQEAWQGDNQISMDDGVVSASTASAAVGAGMTNIEEEVPGVKETKVQPNTLNIVKKRVNITRSNHCRLQALLARAQFVGKFNSTAGQTVSHRIAVPETGYMAFMKLFAYWTGDLNVHLTNSGSGPAVIAHSYWDVGDLTLEKLTTHGAISIPSNQSVSLRVPWYYNAPVRPTQSSNSLGNLLVYSETISTVTIFVSFGTIKLMYPIPPGKYATLRSVISTFAESEIETPAIRIARATRVEEVDYPLHTVDLYQPSKRKPLLAAAMKRLVNAASVWERDLTEEGVEPNPGPLYWWAMAKVEDKTFKGVLCGNYFYYLDFCKNPKGPMLCEHYTHVHQPLRPITDFAEEVSHVDVKIKYVREYEFHNSFKKICKHEHMRFCDTMVNIIWSQQAKDFVLQMPGQDFNTIFGNFEQNITDDIGRLLRQMFSAIATPVLQAIGDSVAQSMVTALIKAICYMLLFYKNPGFMTAGIIATLVSIDTIGCALYAGRLYNVVSAIMCGQAGPILRAIIQLLIEDMDDAEVVMRDALPEFVENEHQGPFQMLSAVRNMDWLLGVLVKIFNWLKAYFDPSEKDKINKWFQYNTTLVAQILMEADEVACLANEAGMNRSAEFQSRVRKVQRALRHLNNLLVKVKIPDIQRQVNGFQARLGRIPMPPPLDKSVMRSEPIGIWLSGDPGCGKSSLAYSIISAINYRLKNKGIQADQIFTHPTGSEYMDNYSGQFFHLIDDLAQDREEKDVKLLCQCISSVPFTTPQAAVEEKGTQYKSQIVIATTNRTDFTTQVLTSSEALRRRFPFTVFVRPTAEYQLSNGRIDLAKAEKDGKIQSGKCWEVMMGNNVVPVNRFSPFDLLQFADQVVDMYETRVKITERMNKSFVGFHSGPVVPTTTESYFDAAESMVTLETPSVIIHGTNVRQSPPFQVVDDAGVAKLISRFDGLIRTNVACDINEDIEDDMEALSGVISDDPFKSTKVNSGFKISGEPTTNISDWVKKKVVGIQDFCKKYRSVFEIAGAVLTVVAGVVTLWKMHGSEEVEEEQPAPFDVFGPDFERERAYTPLSKNKMKEPTARKVPVKMRLPNTRQSPVNFQEYTHLWRCCVTMYNEHGQSLYGVATGPHTITTYKHFLTGGPVVAICWNGIKFNLDLEKVTSEAVYYVDENGVEIESDQMNIHISNLPFAMKSCSKYIGEVQTGSSGILLYGGNGQYAHFVDDVHNMESYVTDGLVYANGIEYSAKTVKGMCGGLLIQKINGQWKAVGMHHSGDNMAFGQAFKIFGPGEQQGLVTKVQPYDSIVFQPTKSGLKKSPVHGVFPVTSEPAVLHGRDRRLDAPIDNMVKHAAHKFRVNHFEPDPTAFAIAKMNVAEKLFSVTGRQAEWTMEQALSGNGSNPIEMSTSPGRKYVEQHLKKRDLVNVSPAGEYTPTLEFRSDVEEKVAQACVGPVGTLFTATLKDELRPTEKIAIGKTRCIEACEFDYVVAHRMSFGPVYEKIYETDSSLTGVSVGINPYTEFHPLFHSMKKHWYAIDYARYDGSLSAKLMQAGAEILSNCTANFEKSMNLMAPVIVSEHVVFDEKWTVDGGMPSGSPCTSVLNSICNLLVVKTCLLQCGLQDLNQCVVYTYGDDVLFSTDVEIDGNKFVRLIAEQFGMEATPATKVGTDIRVTPNTATFLKRHFDVFPGTRFVTGKLDLEAMKQHIMWCRGIENFRQQFDSFLIELVIHGEDVYNGTIMDMAEPLAKYKIYAPEFRDMAVKVLGMIF